MSGFRNEPDIFFPYPVLSLLQERKGQPVLFESGGKLRKTFFDFFINFEEPFLAEF